MKGRRFLIVSFYYEPDLCAGSFRTLAFIRELRKKMREEDTIEVLTTMPNRYHSYEQQASPLVIEKNLTIHRFSVPRHKSGLYDQSKSFSAYYRKCRHHSRKKRYDAVFATSSRLFSAYLGFRIARFQKAPLFLDIRDIFVDTLKSVLAGKWLRFFIPLFLLRSLERRILQYANGVNLVSEGFRDYFLKYVPKDKLMFYSNGIDPEFLEADFRKPDPSEQKTIVYAGNMGDGQGLHKIVPEMAEFLGDRYSFLLIGDGGMRRQLEERIREKNISNVKLIDPVPRKQIIEYYRNCDFLLLHLNDYEAFKKVLPSKIFEYAITGKPVIAGVGGYAAKFIRSRLPEWILFEPADIEDFKRCFNKEAEGPANLEQFIHEFRRETIMENLSAEFLKRCDQPGSKP